MQVLSEAKNRVVAEVPFQVLGLCKQLGGPRHSLPGALMALPESFTKLRQFVDPDKASLSLQHDTAMVHTDVCLIDSRACRWRVLGT